MSTLLYIYEDRILILCHLEYNDYVVPKACLVLEKSKFKITRSWFNKLNS